MHFNLRVYLFLKIDLRRSEYIDLRRQRDESELFVLRDKNVKVKKFKSKGSL